MTHRDDSDHSRRWRWALAVAAAVLVVWAVLELRDMQRRVRYLEDEAERIYWKLGKTYPLQPKRREHDG
jgi:type II secretory pathway component PulL